MAGQFILMAVYSRSLYPSDDLVVLWNLSRPHDLRGTGAEKSLKQLSALRQIKTCIVVLQQNDKRRVMLIETYLNAAFYRLLAGISFARGLRRPQRRL